MLGTGEGTRPHMCCARFQLSGNDFADDLVAGDDSRMERGKFAFDDMEISTADTACENFQENVAGLRVRSGDVFDFQGQLGDWSRRGENCGLHE